MIKETLDISHFNKGLIADTDARDIPLDAFAEGTINTWFNMPGKLYPTQDALLKASIAGKELEWIYRDNYRDLVYADSSSIGVIEDFYGTQTNTFEIIGGYSITTDFYGGTIGTGRTPPSASDYISSNCRWIGIPQHGTFGSSAPVTYQIEKGGITPPNTINNFPGTTADGGFYIATGVSFSSPIGGKGNFVSTKTYFWRISLVYDGVQESPLGAYVAGTPGSTQTQASFTIVCKNFDFVNTRITSVRVYRAEASAGSSATLYRFVDEIDINDSSWYTSTSGNDKEYVFNDQVISPTSTFEAETGYPETYNTCTPNWELSTVALDYHVVGKVVLSNPGYASDLLDGGEGEYVLLRSLPGKYESFRWTDDILRLRYIPTALTSYMGRVYAFGENFVTRINAGGFYIEEEVTNFGASASSSVAVTELGMFFANNRGCYFYDGREVKDLSVERIAKTWQGISGTPVVIHDQKHQAILFIKGSACFSYYYPGNRWDYMTLGISGNAKSGITGINGEPLLSTDSTKLYELYAGTLQTFTYVSPILTFNDASQKKKFYKIETQGTPLNIYYSLDGGSWNLYSNNNILTGKTLQVKIEGNSEIDSLSIIYRRMKGKR